MCAVLIRCTHLHWEKYLDYGDGKIRSSDLRKFDIEWASSKPELELNAAWFWKQSDIIVKFAWRQKDLI
jgi:hypothetical protein